MSDQGQDANDQHLKDVGRRYADIIHADTAITAIDAYRMRNIRG